MLNKGNHFASWDMTRRCNFNCSYCYSHSSMKSSINREVSVKRVTKALKDTGKKSWTVHLTGGEPLLYPNIIGVCKELTNHFEIAINSNLSINSKVREFAHNIDPGKVQYVYASTHIIERERRKGVEDFIDNLMLLKEKGFNVVVNYIFHPSLKRRFLRDYEYFKSRQVKLLPQPFKGIHNLRIYPDWYSEDEKRIILKYTSDEARFPFYSKGLKCDAGRRFIKIDPDGTVTRCIADHSILGNVLEGIKLNNRPEPCKLQVCPCIGLEYIEEAEKKDIEKRYKFDKNIWEHLRNFIFNKYIKNHLLRELAIRINKNY